MDSGLIATSPETTMTLSTDISLAYASKCSAKGKLSLKGEKGDDTLGHATYHFGDHLVRL